VAKAEGELVTPESLPRTVGGTSRIRERKRAKMFEPRKLEEIIEDQVRQTVEYFKGDRDRAARELGISRKRINSIIEQDS